MTTQNPQPAANTVPEIHLVNLSRYSIIDQLQIEEALLRVDHRNWCIINQQAPQAIVMGISSQIDQMINPDKLQHKAVPVIRRFSGGGTVFIDENCYMASFICNSQEMQVPCFPQPVFRWSEGFYKQVFKNIHFALRENDYVIGPHKFGGNAQYMTKDRWLHHSSFLWDYNPANMEYLHIPSKMPAYRQARPHHEFLCKLKDYMPSQAALHEQMLNVLNAHFVVKEADFNEIEKIRNVTHRKATVLL